MALPQLTRRKTQFHLQVTNSDQATAHGGQGLVDSLCRRAGLWQRLQDEPSQEVRKRPGAGFSPVAMVAHRLLTLTRGGASLAAAARLGKDRGLMDLPGREQGADESTLGQWRRAQTPERVRVLPRVNAEWVDWSSPQAQPARWLHGRAGETSFDDPELEVDGHKFEAARINYDGTRALSWPTRWQGPWLLEGILDGAPEVSEPLAVLLDEPQHRWQGRPNYFYADSGSSAGQFLNRIERGEFRRWSVRYNKWTDTLDRWAAARPESQWRALPPAGQSQEQHTWGKPQPGECAQVQRFATVRGKNNGALLWPYAYVACQAGTQDTPRAVFERHHLKGAKEQGLSDVPGTLDLPPPPCQDLIANQAFQALGLLAHNILISLRVLDLPEEAQGWRLKTMIRPLLTVPVSVSPHARATVARLCVPTGWMRWWRLFLDKGRPKRTAGRPVLEVVDSRSSQPLPISTRATRWQRERGWGVLRRGVPNRRQRAFCFCRLISLTQNRLRPP